VAAKLRDFGARYLLARRVTNNLEVAKADRAEYRDLQKLAHRFVAELDAWNDRDIAGDMALAARIAGEPEPLTNFPKLSEHEKQRGDAYYHELIRLLGLLEVAAQQQFRRLAPSKGRRSNNYELEILIGKLADFWVDSLGRKFSLDYHDGTGLSEAFQFVQAVIGPIDKIPDKHIVTVMRTVIRARGTMAKRPVHSPAA
jgi:hypothetical protein